MSERVLRDDPGVVRVLTDAVSMLTGLRPIRDGAGSVPVEIVHGNEEQWRTWERYAATHPPQAPFNVYPTLDGIREVIAPDIARATAPHRDRMRPRIVIPAAAVLTAADRATVGLLVEAGAEVRLGPSAPSWLYVDPEVLWALPLAWGDYPPASIMIGTDAGVGAALTAYADLLWRGAAPFEAAGQPWDAVLQLLARGLPDRAIAAALEVSLRTVERRIAEATAHHGVATRFELGIAWGRQVSGTGR